VLHCCDICDIDALLQEISVRFQRPFPLIFAMLVILSGCQERETKSLDDLATLKNEFITEIFNGSLEESPFDLSYNLRTVFHSERIVSLFGEFHQYTHLPHGWKKYEGKTFYKKNGKFIPVGLNGLFSTLESMEFIRKFCENALLNDCCSYFSGKDPLRNELKFSDLNVFVLDDQELILVFQPYTVAGGTDGPPIVKIPWSDLQGIIDLSNPFFAVLNETLSHNNFVASWDENALDRSLQRDGRL